MAKQKEERYITTRKVYKGVKTMDHRQFDDFCTNVYKEGYEDGRQSVPGIDVTEVMEAIASVKGIGERRIQKIKEALDVKFGGAGGAKED